MSLCRCWSLGASNSWRRPRKRATFVEMERDMNMPPTHIERPSDFANDLILRIATLEDRVDRLSRKEFNTYNKVRLLSRTLSNLIDKIFHGEEEAV